MKNIFLLFFLGIFTWGCDRVGDTSGPYIINTKSPRSTVSVLSTITLTLAPTSTRTPTDTPIPTETPVPIIAKIYPNLEQARDEGFHLLAGPPPFEVDFSAEVEGGSGNLTYAWDFDGDGSIDSSDSHPEPYSFETSGVYTATLIVSDLLGQELKKQQRIVVIDTPDILPGYRGVGQDLAWDPQHQVSRIINFMDEGNVEWVRMVFRWNMLERSQAIFTWEPHDSIVKNLRNQEIRIYGLIVGVPTWANGKSSDNVNVNDGEWPDVFPPKNTRDFSNHVFKVIDHYKNTVDAWVLFNEPNIKQFWRPEPNITEYVDLLCSGYYAAKYANPNSIIAGGSFSGNGVVTGWLPPESSNFLQKMYDHGASGCYDVIDIHPYIFPDPKNINELQRWVDATRDVMLENNDPRPIWVGEIGWSTVTGAWGATATEQQISSWIETVYTQLDGVENIFWYNFKDIGIDPEDIEHHFGLLTYDLIPKPAYDAYKALSEIK